MNCLTKQILCLSLTLICIFSLDHHSASANPYPDFTLHISEMNETATYGAGKRMEQSLTKLEALEDFSTQFEQVKSEKIPSLLSIFTLSSADTHKQAGPKVIIKSIDPLQMTFLFTFEFGET